jgi:serine/threonine-protein kinase
MAEVFAARIRGEAGFEKLVAVKRMLPHLAGDEHFVEMFLDEAKLAVHVASPHVVQTLDLGRADDGALFIAMELVIGSSLASLFREVRGRGSRVPPRLALEILAQAAQGLDAAHEATTPTGTPLGIVHRDVSPQNVLVGLDGRTRVADFGVARAMLRRSSTGAGELKGKIAYFSPEQAAGQEVDRRADVFALGCVAYEVLAGRRLFFGADALEILQQVRAMPIPRLHEIDETIPFAASEAVARALARPRDERWPTAGAFAVALRGAAEELGPRASAREIGAWVGEAGGAPLAEMRARIERALAGGEAKVDRPPTDRAAAQPGTGALFGVTSDSGARPTTASKGRGGIVAAAVVSGVIVVGALGWVGRGWIAGAGAGTGAGSASASPAAAGSASAAVAASVSASVAASGAAAATVAPSVANPVGPAVTTTRSLATASPTPTSTSSVTVTASAAVAPSATVSAPAAPTAPPPPATTAAAPKGPILGDDAFTRDLGKMK